MVSFFGLLSSFLVGVLGWGATAFFVNPFREIVVLRSEAQVAMLLYGGLPAPDDIEDVYTHIADAEERALAIA